MSITPPNNHLYGSLCSLYYDLKEGFAPKQEVDFYARFMHPEHRTLEAMSGSGRVQIPLLQRGFKVDGVDNSPEMLARCKKRCEKLNLSAQLYQQNLERLALPTLYHTIFIALGSFQLIADKNCALNALQRLHAHLVPGGTLLLDIFMPDPAQNNQSIIDTRAINSFSALRLTAYYSFDRQEQIVRAECLYELLEHGIVQKREHETMLFAWYTHSELLVLLQKAGFEVVTTHEQFFRSTGLASHIIEAKARHY